MDHDNKKKKWDHLEEPKIPEDKKSNSENSEGNYMSLGMCIGMCLGITAGQFLFDNLATGLSIGMCLGLAVGISIKKKK
jgi:galactitol-specific phosphotransferase system IIC component